MSYVQEQTHIPVPRVLHFCAELDGDGVDGQFMLQDRVSDHLLRSF
jgi:hypothetical protein